MASRGRLAWVGFALSLALSAPAAAQDTPPDASTEEARGLFEAGRVAFAEGRFEAALRRFQDAYEVSGHPELLYNVGMCLERLQRDEEALAALREYLERVPDSPLRGNVEGRISSLEASVAERQRLEAEAAAASEPETAPAQAPPPAEPEGEDLASAWWLWTLIGVVVVGAGVGIGLGVALSGGTQEPLPGDNGVVVTTLQVARF